MRDSKIMTGSLAGAGTIPMNQVLPRPARETAVDVTPLADGPYDYFEVAGLERLAAVIHVDTGTVTVAMEGAIGDPAEAGSWVALDTTSGLDGGAGAGASAALESTTPVQYLRFVTTAGDAARTVTVNFLGSI